MKIQKLRITMLLSALSCAALLNGCGSSSKAGTTGNAAVVDEGTCIVCHSTTTDPVSGLNLVNEYANAAHNPAAGGPGCQGCHGGGAQHNGVGPIPFPNPLALDPTTGKPQCYNAACHGDASSIIPGVVATANTSLNFPVLCSHCHSTTANGDIHGAQVTSKVMTASGTDPDDCVFCHNVAAPQHGALVNDNNGVRSIVPEFQKTSHHIVNANGAAPTKAQCAVCHAEGTVGSDGSSIVVDSNFHMKDGHIYLRNGNSALGQTPDKSTLVATTVGTNPNPVQVSVYAWNPATPDHTLMDQFCFSCHNAAGAPTTYATLGNGVNDKNLVLSSATNPFGDTISNGYDQMARSSVVNVYDAFSPTNASHHAVRGQKYTSRTRAGSTATVNGVTGPALFTQYSGAAVTPSNTGANTNGNAGIGPLSPGSRHTIYEAGFFVSNYTPLGASATVGDDSTLHCGDCHTVGQWKPNSTTAVTSNPDGTTTVVASVPAIGAHGSNNEYLLRRSDGVDALHHQATTNGTSLTNQTVGGTYVCFLCHRQGVYGEEEYIPFAANPTNTYAVGRLGGHGGTHPCNDASNGESTGLTGSARVAPHEDGEWGGGNLYGYTCGHCHNSGAKGFGGIHGNLASFGNAGTWGVYSASGGYASAVNTTATVTYRKSYRFMGGLSLRYNGGATASKWESQVLQKSNREGCYNFTVAGTIPNSVLANGVPGPFVARPALTADKNEWVYGPSTPAAPAANVLNEFTDGANAGQTYGTWGSCSHHNGSTTSGSNASSLRKVQRPLTY
jgi:hypothetical protein